MLLLFLCCYCFGFVIVSGLLLFVGWITDCLRVAVASGLLLFLRWATDCFWGFFVSVLGY